MRILIYGDLIGVPQLLKHIPKKHIAGIVAAENRPQFHSKLEQIAADIQVPFVIHLSEKRKAYQAYLASLKDIGADMLWSNSFSMKIGQRILDMHSFGGLNLHGALLPFYRGCNPMQWSILNDEHQTGITLHEMDASIDTGKIIDSIKVPIRLTDTWVDLQKRIFDAGDKLISRMLKAVLAGKWVAVLQDETCANYYPRRTRESGRFEWGEPLVHIYNLIRALVAPHPGAFYRLNGGEEHVIDVFKTLSQLSVMKFRHHSSAYILNDAAGLSVEPIEVNATDAIHFEIKQKNQVLGSCGIRAINWSEKKCKAVVDLGQRGCTYGEDCFYQWLGDFSRTELRLVMEVGLKN